MEKMYTEWVLTFSGIFRNQCNRKVTGWANKDYFSTNETNSILELIDTACLEDIGKNGFERRQNQLMEENSSECIFT